MKGYPLFEHYNIIFKFLLDVKMTVLDSFMTALIFLNVYLQVKSSFCKKYIHCKSANCKIVKLYSNSCHFIRFRNNACFINISYICSQSVEQSKK